MSTLGASFLEEVHCGYCDRQLCFFWECEGWGREAEGTEEGKEAPCQDELQVTCLFPFSFCQSVSFHFSFLIHSEALCQYLFIMSDKEVENRCYVYLDCPQGNTDELNLWPLSVIGGQNYKSIFRIPASTYKELFSKLLPWHYQNRNLSLYVKVCMNHAYFSSLEILIFKWIIKENQ